MTTTRPTEAAATASFTYDEGLNRRSVTSSAGTTSYCFDARNRLQDAYLGAAPDCASPPAGVLRAHYEYTRDSQLAQVSLPDGSQVDYGYEENTNALSDATHSLTPTTPPAADLGTYHYEHDGNGNIEAMTETLQGVTGAMETQTTQVTSDAMGRPLEIARDEVTQQHTRSFTYGASYNRQTEEVDDAGAVTTRRYFYEGANRIDRVEETGPAPALSATLDYTLDAAGNTVARTKTVHASPETVTTTHFVYDGQNQLEHVDQDGGPALAEYAYDEAGRRTRQRTSGRDVSYQWDGLSLLEEHDPSSGALVAHYRYADRLLSLTTAGSAPQYYHHDGLRNTVALTTAPTVVGDPPDVLATYRTDLFGTIREQTGTSHNRNVFSGHENDDATGLVYMKSRYYDPALGRFLTQDTYLGQTSDAPSLNRYTYARGNPGSYWDPDGHDNLPFLSGDQNTPQAQRRALDQYGAFRTPNGVFQPCEGGGGRTCRSTDWLDQTASPPTTTDPTPAPASDPVIHMSVEPGDASTELPTTAPDIVNPGGLDPSALTVHQSHGSAEPTRTSTRSSELEAIRAHLGYRPTQAYLNQSRAARTARARDRDPHVQELRRQADKMWSERNYTFEEYVLQQYAGDPGQQFVLGAGHAMITGLEGLPHALFEMIPAVMAYHGLSGAWQFGGGVLDGDIKRIRGGAWAAVSHDQTVAALLGVGGLVSGFVGGIHDIATADNPFVAGQATVHTTASGAQLAGMAFGIRGMLRGAFSFADFGDFDFALTEADLPPVPRIVELPAAPRGPPEAAPGAGVYDGLRSPRSPSVQRTSDLLAGELEVGTYGDLPRGNGLSSISGRPPGSAGEALEV